MFLNNYCSVSIAVGFSQRAGNGTIPRWDFSPRHARTGFYFGAKAPLRAVLPSIRQLKLTAMDIPARLHCISFRQLKLTAMDIPARLHCISFRQLKLTAMDRNIYSSIINLLCHYRIVATALSRVLGTQNDRSPQHEP